MADWSADLSDVWTALKSSRKSSNFSIKCGQTYSTWWMARIRKENVAIPHQEVDILFNFEKCYYCALSVNLTCILTHPLFRDIFSSFYANWTFVTGKTYWCRWSLFFPNQWLHNVWILVALYNCDFKNTFPGLSLKHSFNDLPLPSLVRKITYIKTVLRQKRSQI